MALTHDAPQPVPAEGGTGAARSARRPPVRDRSEAVILALRLLARVVDFAMASALLLGVAVATGTFGESSGSAWPGSLLLFGGLVLAEATLVRLGGRTPGKAAFGLTVSAPAGGRLPWWRAALRALLAWSPLYPVMLPLVASGSEQAAALVLLAALAGPAAVRSDHRGLHDLVAGGVVSRPARVARDRLLRLGIDLAVFGGAVFAGASVAYGYATVPGFWTVDRVPYGLSAQLSFHPHASEAYIFARTATGRGLDCTVTTAAGRTVSLGAAHPPAYDDHVRALNMPAVYRFPVGEVGLYTVACGAPGQAGEYAVGAPVTSSRTTGNVLEGAGLGLFLAGMALIVVQRRRITASVRLDRAAGR